MSLVSSDAEGEQNEIRSLQEKLESTMRLVANLSGQLSELKEQVPTRSALFCGSISTPSCHFYTTREHRIIFHEPELA